MKIHDSAITLNAEPLNPDPSGKFPIERKLMDNSVEIYRLLEKDFQSLGLHRPMRIERYEAGTELNYAVANVDNGHKAGIWVGMCGEMAGDPGLSLILLGLGLDEFSTSPILLPEVKKIIRAFKLSDAKKITAKALTLKTGKEIGEFVRKKLKEVVPDLATYI